MLRLIILILVLLLLGGLVSWKKQIPKECYYTTGIIVAKRNYCTGLDCNYTLIIEFDDKSDYVTEVVVPYEKYQFKLVGQHFDILVCR